MFPLPDYGIPELAPINPDSRQNCNVPFSINSSHLFIPFIHPTNPFSSSSPSSRSVTNALSMSESSPSPPTTTPTAPRYALPSPSTRMSTSTTTTQRDEVRALASRASSQRFSHGPLFFTLTFPAGSVNAEWDDTQGNGAMYPTLGMHPPAARAHHHDPYAMPPHIITSLAESASLKPRP